MHEDRDDEGCCADWLPPSRSEDGRPFLWSASHTPFQKFRLFIGIYFRPVHVLAVLFT